MQEVPNIQSNNVRWFWFENDEERWVPYIKDVSDKIEQNFKSKDLNPILFGNYSIEPLKKVQTNVKTNFKREMTRGTWFKENYNGDLIPLVESKSELLEKSYLSVKIKPSV